MSVTEAFVKRQMAANWSTLRFPPDEDGLKLLVDTLVRCSRSEAHCRRICEEIRDAPGEDCRWPSSNVVRDVAWALLSDDEKQVGCARCQHTGYISSSRLIGGVRYDFSERCSCLGPTSQQKQREARGLTKSDPGQIRAGLKGVAG